MSYQKLDKSVNESLPESHAAQYEEAVNKSKNGQHIKALAIFENLLLEHDIASYEKYFSMIDVRYQSIIRATSQYQRANLLYEKLILNGYSYDYVKTASNFNKFLLARKNTQNDISILLSEEEYAELPNEHKKNIIYLAKAIINEGLNDYPEETKNEMSSENDQREVAANLSRNVQFSKFSGGNINSPYAKKIQSYDTYTLYEVEFDLINGHSESLVKKLSHITNNEVALTTFKYLSAIQKSNQLTKIVSEFSNVLYQYISDYVTLYENTKLISRSSPYSPVCQPRRGQ